VTIRRAFAPQFVFVVGGWFVAVDRIQPVAVVLSTGGDLTSIVSWADLVAAPRVTPWPSRRIGAEGDRIVVQDLPDTPPVTLTIGPDGDARASTGPTPGEPLRPRKRSQLWTAGPRTGDEAAPWSFGSALDGLAWSARIGRAGAADLDLAGSIVDFGSAGETALACVQRVDKRPWPFDRHAQLLLLSTRDSEVVAHPVPNPDVGGLCWPARYRDRPDTAALHEYLLFSLRQAGAVTDLGGRDPRLTVTGALDDPRIELAFQHADFPDREFRRVDRPFNELGNLGEGLRELHIGLHEDIETGVLAHCAARTDAPIVYF
jgi:hypothetical protein